MNDHFGMHFSWRRTEWERNNQDVSFGHRLCHPGTLSILSFVDKKKIYKSFKFYDFRMGIKYVVFSLSVLINSRFKVRDMLFAEFLFLQKTKSDYVRA